VYQFTGDVPLLYTQYLDGDGAPLFAEPGESYDMQPAAGRNLPVPPGDGRWQDPPATETKSNGKPAQADTAAPKPDAADNGPQPRTDQADGKTAPTN